MAGEGRKARLIGLAAGLALGLQGATQFVGWSLAWAPALGPRLILAPDLSLYPPWGLLAWRPRLRAEAPELLKASLSIFLLSTAAGAGIGALLAGEGRPARARGWGGLREAKAGGLLDGGGAILGELQGRLLATEDLRPSLVTGGTRSGKGRGHVVPTLLSWNHSVLVHDPKGELWRLTAGFRGRFSHTLYFDPRSSASMRWNPLAEITPGPAELAQVQRLAAILSDPGGRREDEAIWDKAACEILEAVILHVLYTATDEAKTLVTVREMLADLDAAADEMARTLHRLGPDGTPQTHPFIAVAVTGYAAMHDRFRTSVQGTARAYLKWLAGEDVERALGASDLRLGDLMCAYAPVSLYVQLAPADGVALRPLVRLLFYAAAQALTTAEAQDHLGRPKAWRLLMVMDEFPLLGRLAFFEKSLRLMSGYGIKPMLVAQSLNDIQETYGAQNTILDNCHVYTAFAALDPGTQDRVSRLTGSTLEVRVTRSSPAGLSPGHGAVSRTALDRPLMEPGEIRALGDDEQLVFVAGQRPLRARKLRFDKREPFRRRSKLAAPDQAKGVDSPEVPPHPWAGRRSLGRNPNAALPAFKEVEAAIQDKKASSRVADLYDRVAADLAAQQAALDHLQGRGHGPR